VLRGSWYNEADLLFGHLSGLLEIQWQAIY